MSGEGGEMQKISEKDKGLNEESERVGGGLERWLNDGLEGLSDDWIKNVRKRRQEEFDKFKKREGLEEEVDEGVFKKFIEEKIEIQNEAIGAKGKFGEFSLPQQRKVLEIWGSEETGPKIEHLEQIGRVYKKLGGEQKDWGQTLRRMASIVFENIEFGKKMGGKEPPGELEKFGELIKTKLSK